MAARQPPALPARAWVGDTAVEFAGRRFDFHQPLPGGLLAVVLSGCSKLCGEGTEVWRKDLITIMAAGHATQPDIELATPRRRLAEEKPTAASMRVHGVDSSGLQSDIWALEAEIAAVEAMAAAGVQVEVSVGQRGASSIVISAGCHAGGHAAVLDEQRQLFKRQMYNVIAEHWPGCSPTESEVGMEPT